MIVAIDGPAGVGKSTVAKRAAKECGLLYISSGKFYRSVAYRHLRDGLDPADEELIVKTAQSCRFSIQDGEVLLDGEHVEQFLHTPEIDMASSAFSVIIPVRMAINEALRRAAESLDIIMEGRDITTVVFPNADVKFFFDASLEERTKRRLQDYGEAVSFDGLKGDIEKRDEQDRNKEFGALKRAEDALYIDTSYLTIDEVCDKVVQNILSYKQSKDQESY